MSPRPIPERRDVFVPEMGGLRHLIGAPDFRKTTPPPARRSRDSGLTSSVRTGTGLGSGSELLASVLERVYEIDCRQQEGSTII